MFGDNLVVVSQGGMDDFGRFAMAFEDIGADFGVSPFHIMVGGLANVVQQSAAAAQGTVQADQFRQHPRQESDLDRMAQHVLAVAGAKVQASQQVDDAGGQPWHIGFVDRLFALLLNELLHLLSRFRRDLFDA